MSKMLSIYKNTIAQPAIEEWRDVKGYEGLYQVSNLGNVKALGRDYYHSNGHALVKHYVKEHIVNGRLRKDGYYDIDLHKDGKLCKKLVHRLVAEAFVPNPNNYRIIHHLDCNKANEKADNLMWCTQSFNVQHAYDFEGKQQAKGEECTSSKKVIQTDLNGNILNVWPSLSTVKEKLGYNPSTLAGCANGHNRSAYGCLWVYGKENIPRAVERYYAPNKCCKKVAQILNGKVIKIYNSLKEAGAAVGLKSYTPISLAIAGRYKESAGYQWKYVNENI